eukprot:4894168-Pyramimonas_sp.AAC.1
MEATGVEADAITYSAMISACEKGKQWEKALELFNQMREGEGKASTAPARNSYVCSYVTHTCAKISPPHLGPQAMARR